MKIHRRVLEARAKDKRAAYLEACAAAGQWNGEYLLLSPEAWARLSRRYRGLGDWLHLALLPLAVWSDRHFKTRLVGCSACARRQAALNRLGQRLAARWSRSVRRTAKKQKPC